MFTTPLQLDSPGLFITATDTGVGKTVVTCAIAAALRRQNPATRVGVSKPFSSGCRVEREGLVNEDTEALAHFANAGLPLDVINPIRFRKPLAPAVAAEAKKVSIDFDALQRSMQTIAAQADITLVEGAGGLLVPIDPNDPKRTILDLAATVGYPVLVVCRSLLGTLNHTAMTVELLKRRGCRVAGIVMNGYDSDLENTDPSVKTNRLWLEKMTGSKVVIVLPRFKDELVQPHQGVLEEAMIDLMTTVNWHHLAGRAARTSRP